MEKVIARTFELLPMRIISYCLMSNHWHFVLWPRKDGELSDFMRLLTVTHTQRWHAYHYTAGTGPLYQGRFKSFPIQQDEHFLNVCRYVERNALRARMVRSAENWPWCSLAKRQHKQMPEWLLPPEQWPVIPPRNFTALLNRPQSTAEIEALQLCIKRGRPYGNPHWQEKTARNLNLQSTLRPRGRQRIRPIKDSRPL